MVSRREMVNPREMVSRLMVSRLMVNPRMMSHHWTMNRKIGRR